MKLKVNKNDISFGTNVLDIEVPAVLRERFATGIDYIDGALGGQGFTPSTVTLFTGEPGAGKTTMMLNLADRITAKKGIALFNTAEESLYQTALTAQRLKLRNGFATGNIANVYDLLGRKSGDVGVPLKAGQLTPASILLHEVGKASA